MNEPIGIFDSGVGGLSILRAIIDELPNENIVYFADSDRCPYGLRSEGDIKGITKSITNYLLKNYNVKLVVLACNTATVASIDYLREEFSQLSFVGVVPVIKPASLLSKKKVIGCLATDTTVNSKAQAELIYNFAENVKVYNVACHGLVELIENGLLNSNLTKNKLMEYIYPLVKKDIDVLALGCTHYPLLKEQIKSILHKGITILDSSKPVAKQVKRVLTQKKLLNLFKSPKYNFLVNGNTDNFTKVARVVLNGHFLNVSRVTIV